MPFDFGQVILAAMENEQRMKEAQKTREQQFTLQKASQLLQEKELGINEQRLADERKRYQDLVDEKQRANPDITFAQAQDMGDKLFGGTKVTKEMFGNSPTMPLERFSKMMVDSANIQTAREKILTEQKTREYLADQIKFGREANNLNLQKYRDEQASNKAWKETLAGIGDKAPDQARPGDVAINPHPTLLGKGMHALDVGVGTTLQDIFNPSPGKAPSTIGETLTNWFADTKGMAQDKQSLDNSLSRTKLYIDALHSLAMSPGKVVTAQMAQNAQEYGNDLSDYVTQMKNVGLDLSPEDISELRTYQKKVGNIFTMYNAAETIRNQNLIERATTIHSTNKQTDQTIKDQQ